MEKKMEAKLEKFPYTMTYSQFKSGSTTVMNAVGSLGVPCHRCYAGNVKKYHKADMPTITMVREPIERYLSELWEIYLANPKSSHPKETPMDVMQKQIMESVAWFGLHYRPITGINVYGRQFNRKTGYMIYSIRGLVIRTSRLSDALEPALKEFIPPYFPDADFSNIDLTHRAKGDDRFGKKYKTFCDKVKFPKDFLIKLYDTQFSRNFFYVKELNSFIKRWKE